MHMFKHGHNLMVRKNACAHELYALPHALLLRMLNFTVYSKTHRKTLVPWRIQGVPALFIHGHVYT